MSTSFRDPGGSFPLIPTYSHNAKKNRLINEIHKENSSYITLTVNNPNKSLKDISPFTINSLLNQITKSWKYISSNRNRDIITLLVSGDTSIEKFTQTTSILIGEDQLMVSFTINTALNTSKGTVFCPELLRTLRIHTDFYCPKNLSQSVTFVTLHYRSHTYSYAQSLTRRDNSLTSMKMDLTLKLREILGM